MKIIKFTCHECNSGMDKYYPPIEFNTLKEALEHLKENPDHNIVIFENDPPYNEED